MRIYTHNLFARREGWEQRRTLLRAGIAEMRPDVVLFQEEVRRNGYDQTADLVGDGFHVVHSSARSASEGSGISIASRWPIVAVRELDLTAGGRPVDEYEWATLIATIQAPEPLGRIVVANHFPDAAVDGEAERERQAVLAAEALRADAARHPVIIAGDFDAEPDAGSLRFLIGRQSLAGQSVAAVRAWDAVHPGHPCVTLDPDNPLVAAQLPGWPFREIDHILVWCGPGGLPALRVDACERVMLHDGDTWASDHHGLRADLSVPVR